MNASPKSKISPTALLQTIKVNLLRRPLWRQETVCDCLDLTWDQVKAKIQNGDLAFAFDVGSGKSRSAPRILGLCVVEQQLGPLPEIGATRNLKLEEVINLILPARDVRSTELKKIFAINNAHFRSINAGLVVTRQPAVKDGPDSYTAYSRASVAEFLAQRRIT